VDGFHGSWWMPRSGVSLLLGVAISTGATLFDIHLLALLSLLAIV
jgi:hypothetical protein